MSIERKARIANGMLIVAACLLTVLDDRFVWLAALMGGSLIFSGAADYCGFAKIFSWFEKKNTETSRHVN